MEDMAAAPAAPAQGGFTIEISCLPDGTFQVSSEPLAEEAAEETGAPGSEAGQTVKSLGEALKLVVALYQAGGSTGDDEFSEGYGATAPKQEETVSMEPQTDLGSR